ncbi:MAG: hypothetical protein U0941_10580 [Planctomycetaceae bacterium]
MNHICRHRRNINAVVGSARIEIWNCAEKDLCTEQDHGRKLADGSTPMAVCETCPLFSARGAQTFTAIADSNSPTGFTWNCNAATLRRIGFYPLAGGDIVTVEPSPDPVPAEPVGDVLHALLESIGIRRSGCPVCEEWRRRMNRGIRWCEDNRGAILGRLNEMAKTATWREALAVAGWIWGMDLNRLKHSNGRNGS